MTMPLGSGANSFLTIGLERSIWEIRVSVEFEAALRIRGRGGLFYMGEGRFDSWDGRRYCYEVISEKQAYAGNAREGNCVGILPNLIGTMSAMKTKKKAPDPFNPLVKI